MLFCALNGRCSRTDTVRKVLTLLSSLVLPAAGSRSPDSPLLQLQTFSGARKVPAHSFCVVSVVTCVCSSNIRHLSMSAKQSHKWGSRARSARGGEVQVKLRRRTLRSRFHTA